MTITVQDIVGLNEAKEEVMEVVAVLMHPKENDLLFCSTTVSQHNLDTQR